MSYAGPRRHRDGHDMNGLEDLEKSGRPRWCGLVRYLASYGIHSTPSRPLWLRRCVRLANGPCIRWTGPGWMDSGGIALPPVHQSALFVGPTCRTGQGQGQGQGRRGGGGGVESAALCCWKSQTDRPRPFSHSFLILPALDRCRAQNLRWQRSDGEQGLAGDMVPGHPSLAIHLFKVWTYLWFIRARYPETPLPASVFSRTP